MRNFLIVVGIILLIGVVSFIFERNAQPIEPVNVDTIYVTRDSIERRIDTLVLYKDSLHESYKEADSVIRN